MELAMMDVDDSDHVTAGDQWNGEKCFVGIFHQRLKSFKAMIGGGVGRKCNDGLMLGHPTGDAFAHLHAQSTERGRMWNLRSAQHYFAGVAFKQVDQTSIAVRYLRGESDN